ncbi:GNAT family N-acetyltransferase [Salinarchaeum chitinilyticum]
MPQEIAIRRAEAADAPRIRELNEVALRQVDAYAEDAVEAGMDEDLEDVETNYVEVGGDFLVAETVPDDESDADAGDRPSSEQRIVGMGALEPIGEGTFQADQIVRQDDGPAAEITRMRVDPAFQRQGIGTQLVERLEERARELDYEVLVLDTTARQDGAQRLYESFGYEQADSVQWREYDVLLYRKELF